MLYSLQDLDYVLIKKSRLLPHRDLSFFVKCVNLPNHGQALPEFRQGIKA